jgi:hypothetical protein
MPTYTPNSFSSGAPSVAKTQAYADGLRNYAGGKSVNQTAQQAPQMAAHLSQAPSLDADYLEVYRGLQNDSAVPADQKFDVDRVWRASPNAAIFKPGYEHNPYVTQKVDALRASRVPLPEEQYRGRRPSYESD